MATLRRMLGDIESNECKELMKVIETQNKHTLASWAIDYAKLNYLPIYQQQDGYYKSIIEKCEVYLNNEMTLKDVKVYLKEATQYARDIKDPIIQASARAIATACSTIQSPTNALGFLFYGTATIVYHRLGLEKTREEYDDEALLELAKALDSLKSVCVENEQHPVKVKWNC